MRLNWIVRSMLWFNDKTSDDLLDSVLYRQLEAADFKLYSLDHDERRMIQRMIYINSLEWSFRLFVASAGLSCFKILRDRRAKRLPNRKLVVWFGANLFVAFNLMQYLGFIYFIEKQPEFAQRLRDRYL